MLWALPMFALCLVASSTGVAQVPVPDQHSKETSERVNATQREIERIVFDAQRAGFEQRDLAGYMAAWSEDAQLIGGRAGRAGPYDVALTRVQIEATKRMRFPQLPELKLSYEVQHFEQDGKTALLRTLSTLSGPEAGVEQNGELYRLRREGDSWRVYENRYWPVRVVWDSTVVVYDSDTWRELDAAVEATSEGTIERAYALLSAFRMHEAYTEAKRLTAAYADDIPAWVLRYQVALRIGALEDLQMCNKSIAHLEGH